MKLIEEVQIPLTVVPPPGSCRLIKWHVRDGSHVTVGEILYDLEVDGKVYSIENLDEGYIKIGAPADSLHQVGNCVASIVCDGKREGCRMIGIELSHSQLARLDSLRGGISRREFLLKLVGDGLAEARPTPPPFP
jgi:pyruvate/2-oxoglutarate dehydrogenase complex dihydrolipoamide acyltransferase (E2) component